MNELKVLFLAAMLATVFGTVAFFGFQLVAMEIEPGVTSAVNDLIDNPFEVFEVVRSEQSIKILFIHSMVLLSGITIAVGLSLLMIFKSGDGEIDSWV